MTVTVRPMPLRGTVTAPPSKSLLHRTLICAALADAPSRFRFSGADRLSDDVFATVGCLNALGAQITAEADRLTVVPVRSGVRSAQTALNCGESGSTLRFLLPLVGALNTDALLTAGGRLPRRPLAPLTEQLSAHGTSVSDGFPLSVRGRLTPGRFTLPGGVSSQFISALLLTLPVLDGDSVLTVVGERQSAPYIDLTLDVLRRFGGTVTPTPDGFEIPGRQCFHAVDGEIEGDWSAAAFWLTAGALNGPVRVCGLNPESRQGDRAILKVLSDFGAKVTRFPDGAEVRRGSLRGITLNAADFPDLVPPVAALACAADGVTVITGAQRLRLKESDRLLALEKALGALGADLRQTPDGLYIRGKPALRGGETDPSGDHRIAMAAAIAAAVCDRDVTIPNADCAAKSDPDFFARLTALQTDGLPKSD